MSFRIVFFDVDGTLTDHRDGSISPLTKQAIQTLLHKGIHVVAATGRPLSMCTELKEIGIQTFITANGAYVKHGDEVIHKCPMDQQILAEVIEYAEQQGSGLSFFTDSFSMNGVQSKEIQSALQDTLLLDEYPYIDKLIHTKEVYLLCLYADHHMVKPYEAQFPQLTFSRWHPYICNVLQHDVNKSLAVKEVLSFFGLTTDKAIAFGDGQNDIEMLALAGLGIAMGNAHDALKSVADFVTKKSSEEGVHYALKKHGLI
ncbi:Cof-type HAD-IIB family hydrolase [Alkalicoccobacillus murimartini]|nr:Cof-type HAD-IIB family hydrolase [Alkalicoccobacillus murimartini]